MEPLDFERRLAKLERRVRKRLVKLERRVWVLGRLLVCGILAAGAFGISWHLSRSLGWTALVPVEIAIVVLAIGHGRAEHRGEDADEWIAQRAPRWLGALCVVLALFSVGRWLLVH
jgi:hypothetical protein